MSLENLHKEIKLYCIFNETSASALSIWRSIVNKYADKIELISYNDEYAFRKIDFYDDERFKKIIIVIGGDGTMLRVIHKIIGKNIIVYGLNAGTIGFLLNTYSDESNLLSDLLSAQLVYLYPLAVTVTSVNDEVNESFAVNEISFLRQTSQASHLRIDINSITVLNKMICDGVIVSTPAGSTAYNFAAHGPILPLKSNSLVMTPICPFKPSQWKGAILDINTIIEVHVLNQNNRPVSANADFIELYNIKYAKIKCDTTKRIGILFNEQNSFDTRILNAQFNF